MKPKCFSLGVLFGAAALLLTLTNCARNQHLVGISVQPASVTFGAVDNALFANLKAYGTYQHPPETKDITTQVNWISDIPQVAQVTGGVVSPNTNCGTAGITATLKDGNNLVISNTATITVEGPASQGCPSGGATATLTVFTNGGAGTGTVNSSPGGIDCGSTCSAQFSTGTFLTLTATPVSPSVFGSWTNCDSATNVNPCTLSLTANRTVTVAFN
jgi:hypothetical protein